MQEQAIRMMQEKFGLSREEAEKMMATSMEYMQNNMSQDDLRKMAGSMNARDLEQAQNPKGGMFDKLKMLGAMAKLAPLAKTFRRKPRARSKAKG